MGHYSGMQQSMDVTAFRELVTPLGPIMVTAGPQGLVEVAFQAGTAPLVRAAGWHEGGSLVDEAARQLQAYFGGRRRRFDLALAPRGTGFQRQVWGALQALPYGATSSYLALARALERPGAARAVGAANGANPWPVIVPCHRLVGGDGALRGYRGGLHFKRALLELESTTTR